MWKPQIHIHARRRPEAATRGMCLQTKEDQDLVAPTSSWERHGADPPSEPPEGINPAYTWISDFWSCEL